jgi:hypothetical protein
MKTMRKLRIVSLFFLLIAGFSVQQKVQAQPGVNISFQTFYNDLSPYGRWSTSPQYGSIWTPYADAGFQPYSTNGYWEVTEYGNTWVSDYDWGWAPFHYGRWSYDNYAGWFWIPGYEWGPAWVNWRSGGEYYGWAPLGPGMGINVSVNIPSFWWVFVPQRYISNRYWQNYCAPRGRYSQIYNQTTIINNYYRNDNRSYVYGPRRDEIERVTNRSVPIRQIDVRERGRVIVDRSNGRSNADYGQGRNSPNYGGRPNNGYSQPSDRGRVYSDNQNSDRYNNRGNRDDSYGRVGSNPSPQRSVPDAVPNGRNRDYSPQQSPQYSSPERGNRGSYETNRQPAPQVEQRSERNNPVYSAPSGRSERQADYGNQNRGGNSGSAPAARQQESRGSDRSSGRGSRGHR